MLFSKLIMDHVLFPRFWKEEPALWFAQVEAVFALHNITSDTDKYDYIICELPSTVISLIKDVILDSPRIPYKYGKYQQVKEELIKRLSISKLKKEQIGTKKPSEFYKHLKENADPIISEEILKEIWMKALPIPVNCIVSDLEGDFESVCKVADTIKEYIPVPCCNCSTRIKNKPEAVMVAEDNVSKILENLETQLENIQIGLQKFHMAYKNNNTQLESIQAELHKFKLTYRDNKTILENKQSELFLKTAVCRSNENNNDKILCKFCQREKTSEDENSNRNSKGEELTDHSKTEDEEFSVTL